MLKTLKQARAAFSRLNPEDVRRRAGRSVRVGLIASTTGGYEAMEEALAPAGGPPEDRTLAMSCLFRGGDPNAPAQVDLVLYDENIPVPRGAYVLYRDEPGATLERILADEPDLDLPLARQFPGFRKCVVDRIIHSIARENAIFAVATALPDVIPNLVELPWIFGEWASDTAFLTANQVRMAFLIAAACGKDPGFAHQKAPILSIGAGAFGWRAIARELAGKIPFGAGLIPKGAIAYAGTVIAGKGLELLYHGDGKYSREHQRGFYEEALERGKAVVQSLLPARQ